MDRLFYALPVVQPSNEPFKGPMHVYRSGPDPDGEMQVLLRTWDAAMLPPILKRRDTTGITIIIAKAVLVPLDPNRCRLELYFTDRVSPGAREALLAELAKDYPEIRGQSCPILDALVSRFWGSR